MADPRFYTVAGPFTLEEVATAGGADIARAVDPKSTFVDVKPLDQAGSDDISFIENRRYLESFKKSRAGAILLSADLVDLAPEETALLVCDDAYRSYAKIAAMFYPTSSNTGIVHSTAVIDPSAKIGDGVQIDAGAVILEDAEIGAGTTIGPAAVIHRAVRVGPCQIGSGVALSYCEIGARTIVHQGTCIGQDGFGFAPSAAGHQKVPQLGRVLVGDDVEIGANCTIDRGTGPDTVIGSGTKIDNLVQIAHNVQIGVNCLIAAQVGISGSSIIGDLTMFGGQAGVAGHLKIGQGVRVAGQSGVTKDVAPGITVAGMPAEDSRSHWRRLALLNRLADEYKGKD